MAAGRNRDRQSAGRVELRASCLAYLHCAETGGVRGPLEACWWWMVPAQVSRTCLLGEEGVGWVDGWTMVEGGLVLRCGLCG